MRIQPDMGDEVRKAERLRHAHFEARKKRKDEMDYFANIKKGLERSHRLNELRRIEGHLIQGVQQPFRQRVFEAQRRKMLGEVGLRATPS